MTKGEYIQIIKNDPFYDEMIENYFRNNVFIFKKEINYSCIKTYYRNLRGR